MAYYAAVISLKNTIQRLLDSSHISILRRSLAILKFALKVVGSIEKFLQNNEEMMIKNSSNERVKSLNGQIREAAYKLEDALESHVSNQYDSLGDHDGSSQKIFLDFEEVREEISSFIETMKKIEKRMEEELGKPLPEEEEDDDDVVPLRIDFGGKNSKMVGISKVLSKLKRQLMHSWQSGYTVTVGMAGIGKTALAVKLFEDPDILTHFNPRVFVTVGLKYRFRKAMLSILSQLNYDIGEIRREGNGILAEYIRKSLKGRRYLIVLDDVWNTKDVKELNSLLPTGSRRRILLTTRSQEVAHYHDVIKNDVNNMSFLSKEESWDLLREKVFGEGYLCPYKLEKFGKKIAENCEGLPLAIVMVANILSKEEKNLEYWKKTAEKQNSVFTDAYDQMWEVLISSYNYLPQYLKPYFLYMANFPQSCKIPTSKLDQLWHSEGFYPRIGLTDVARKCLRILVSRNIVLVKMWSSRSKIDIKTCYLHSAYWHLCTKEASKEKFLHAINRYATSFTDSMKSQRRVCIHNNVLFAIKEVHNSMRPVSMAHSLLCTGPHHQYPVPIYFGLRLLRVLDALTIRFYKFPMEVLKLVQLRYLALTYSGKVPSLISKLRNLEHLIVHRHLSINKSPPDSSYLPMEIWNMKELRHIQVTGGNLPNPCGASLPNLLILSNMSVNSCSKEILQRTPALMKLGIQIELSPDVVEPLCCFDHLSHLYYLESLKCAIVNPKPKSQVVASIKIFPTLLKKLSLSGLGYPWDYMRTIAKLPNLEVLKLRCYAFQGSLWRIDVEEFMFLKYLLIEDTDLVHWRCDYAHCLRSLNRLIIRHCYKLKEIPSTISVFPSLDGRPSMELVDCPSFYTSAEQLEKQFKNFDISVFSSLDDEELQS